MRPFYWVVKTAVYFFFRICYRISVTGVENIPMGGGFIIAPNHASMLDPPAVGCILPREVSFMAKMELFKIPVMREFLNYVRAIPVDRTGYSAAALKNMIGCLKKGRTTIMFPEGTRTRTGDFLEPKKGVGMIAVMADVPVVPCWVEGSFHSKPFVSKITIHFMPQFHPNEIDAPSKKVHYLLVSERIMCDIKKLHEKHFGHAQ